MGLVFRELMSTRPVIIKKETGQLTSSSITFLKSLGFKVQNDCRRKRC